MMMELHQNHRKLDTVKEVPETTKHVGPPYLWKLLGKTWDSDTGFMRSTKAMEVPGGVVIQTSTIQRNVTAGVSYEVCDALVFVPGAAIGQKAEDETYALQRADSVSYKVDPEKLKKK